jgi:predicted cupin superfamily sugar epimerase
VNKPTSEELIIQLGLVKHPEGGWYRETYRSEEVFSATALSGRFSGERSVSTAIYFLLQAGDISALHRIASDEIWHFYTGETLTVHVITPQGEYSSHKLGSDIAASESFQCVVPACCWFGAEVTGDNFALVGCTVAPGFDFADFEMGNRESLLIQFPEHSEIIQRLARNSPESSHPEIP